MTKAKQTHIAENLERIEKMRQSIPRVLFIVAEDRSASWQYRIAWPCEVLSNRGFIADWCTTVNAPSLIPLISAGRYNVVVTPRIHWVNPNMAQEWVDLVHGTNLAWVYEVDDDGWAPDIAQRQARLIEAEYWRGEMQLEADRNGRIEVINQVDSVIVSTERLAGIARSFTTKPVFTVPNLINAAFYDTRLSDAKRLIPPLTVGWSGGLRDDSDLAEVAKAWTIIAERYPDVRFIVHGTRLPVLMASVPAERLSAIAWSSLPDYPRTLMNIDIACCAVAEGNEFNESKSTIKWWETTLAGSACVVSRALYGPGVRDGFDALVATSADEWVTQISKFVESAELRRKIQRNAKRTVLAEHNLSTGWPTWFDALSKTIELRHQISHNGHLVHAN